MSERVSVDGVDELRMANDGPVTTRLSEIPNRTFLLFSLLRCGVGNYTYIDEATYFTRPTHTADRERESSSVSD